MSEQPKGFEGEPKNPSTEESKPRFIEDARKELARIGSEKNPEQDAITLEILKQFSPKKLLLRLPFEPKNIYKGTPVDENDLDKFEQEGGLKAKREADKDFFQRNNQEYKPYIAGVENAKNFKQKINSAINVSWYSYIEDIAIDFLGLVPRYYDRGAEGVYVIYEFIKNQITSIDSTLAYFTQQERDVVKQKLGKLFNLILENFTYLQRNPENPRERTEDRFNRLIRKENADCEKRGERQIGLLVEKITDPKN